MRRIGEMYERQAKEGLLLQQRGAEWLSSSEAEAASPEAAIRAVVEGAAPRTPSARRTGRPYPYRRRNHKWRTCKL